MPLVKASNTISYFSGAGNFTPLIGALIADSFAGRYWTILVGSIIYELVSAPSLCVRARKYELFCFSLSRTDSMSRAQFIFDYLGWP